MANNRMYLVCELCAVKPETTIEECIQFFAKYLPSDGWYIPRTRLKVTHWNTPEETREEIPTDIAEKIDGFLAAHGHGTLLGNHIRVMYEDRIFPEAAKKQDILRDLGGALSDAMKEADRK